MLMRCADILSKPVGRAFRNIRTELASQQRRFTLKNAGSSANAATSVRQEPEPEALPERRST